MQDSSKLSRSSGYCTQFYPELARLEAGHFWFRARNRLILGLLEQYLPELQSFLEIGCGTGFVLSALAKHWPDAKLQGSDTLSKGLEFAARRLPGVALHVMDARAIPFREEFEAIGAFDVLEHVKEDERIMEQVCAALKPGGIFLLSVPQHPWLWSQVDQASGHQRRYTVHDLHSKLTRNGFAILRSTSFVCLPLPMMFVSRWRTKKVKNIDPLQELQVHPMVNTLLTIVLNMEVTAVRRGINLPCGGSRLVVAQKRLKHGTQGFRSTLKLEEETVNSSSFLTAITCNFGEDVLRPKNNVPCAE